MSWTRGLTTIFHSPNLGESNLSCYLPNLGGNCRLEVLGGLEAFLAMMPCDKCVLAVRTCDAFRCVCVTFKCACVHS